MPVALVTGGSAGLGRALAHALAADGWSVVVDGRDPARLASATDHPGIVPIAGDVTDEWHRGALLAAVEQQGRLDLLVHNASTLGPTPLPRLDETTTAEARQVWETNVAAPLALTADLLPLLVASRGTLLSVSSDAAVAHYPGWGLYGASKAALDHATLTFGAENTEVAAYAVDPGDLRTQMHQDAFPGEDISDRPLPESVVPHLLALLAARPPSGRYRAAQFAADAVLPVGA
jgi:NAD(P)-dependent dehydrogenase (short-subunit alcohol dehydrogenase family)